ncbi:MAG TPA: UvrB/UvrC motif-containing protein [Candidatus Onthoplasma faecipullorum]|nr:UvrB/UvrC motif-containing protein [Candidatus Onthoplasma faecipullorum]
MQCDRCGKPSVYHSTLIVNGVSQTTNLCRDCAIKEGVFNSAPTSIFDDMFSAFADFMPYEQVQDITCPVCKTTLREFKNTSKLGCPNCYDAFREEISNIIGRIAPYSTHKVESLTQTKEKPSKKVETKEEKIKQLREDMALAVKEERYEDAGKIKKQIQRLESENE